MNDNTNKKVSKTRLNKAYRNGLTVNSRKGKNGIGIEYVCYLDQNDVEVTRTIDTNTANGGNMTPFNIQCNCDGACAIRKIIEKGDETIVLFADGDRVVLHRHESDQKDSVTAVLWALGQKVFGTGLARQIHSALKYRTVDTEKIRSSKIKVVNADSDVNL